MDRVGSRKPRESDLPTFFHQSILSHLDARIKEVNQVNLTREQIERDMGWRSSAGIFRIIGPNPIVNPMKDATAAEFLLDELRRRILTELPQSFESPRDRGLQVVRR